MSLKSNDFYDYSAAWSEEDGCFVARVAQFPSLSAHGSSKSEAISELKGVVADALEILSDEDE